MAETKWCLPLFDRQYLLTNLKRRVEFYPSPLHRLVRHSLWTAEFAFTHAYGFAQREDIFNAVGCLARIAFMLAQSLFALNAEYYFGDKGALEASTDFPGNLLNFPGGFKGCSRFRREIRASWSPPFAKMHVLWKEVADLTEGRYTPKS